MSEHVARFKTSELAKGEEVQTWCDGTSRDHDEAGALIVTNQRVVFFRWAKRNSVTDAIPRDRIIDIERQAGPGRLHTLTISGGTSAFGGIQFETDDRLSLDAIMTALHPANTGDADETMVARRPARPTPAAALQVDDDGTLVARSTARPAAPDLAAGSQVAGSQVDDDGTIIARPVGTAGTKSEPGPAPVQPISQPPAAVFGRASKPDVMEPDLARTAAPPPVRRQGSGMSPVFLLGVGLLAVALFLGLVLI